MFKEQDKSKLKTIRNKHTNAQKNEGPNEGKKRKNK